jgi:hypothetical protein
LAGGRERERLDGNGKETRAAGEMRRVKAEMKTLFPTFNIPGGKKIKMETQ